MDLDKKLMLISSLGQIKQIRVWLPLIDFPEPEDEELQYIESPNNKVIHLNDLEADLFGKLTKLLNYLSETHLLENEQLYFEIDLESMEETEAFSVMLNSDGELILLYSSKTDKQRMQQWLMIEWTKRLARLVN